MILILLLLVGVVGIMEYKNVRHRKMMVRNSQILRKNMTPEERHLWYDFLKLLPITVKRQRVIGRYIVDFCISRAKLVIEIDGAQHFEKEHHKEDKIRDEFLKALGITVLRYTNSDITKNFDAVCEDILNHIPSLSNIK